ncbi:MAG: hypothetical protein ACKO7P_07550, partial [Bacteroidota bacterium]
MSNSRFIILFAFLIFSALKIDAQNLQKPSNSEIERAPQWAQLMYSENPSIYEVDKLFREYYSVNTFQKSYHTQYYKRWRRKYLNYADANGFIHEPSQAEVLSNEQAYRKKQTNTKSSNW